ncbi:hypothetical protein PSPO01_08510 [Paraphaeosphaeria sporulosa]
MFNPDPTWVGLSGKQEPEIYHDDDLNAVQVDDEDSKSDDEVLVLRHNRLRGSPFWKRMRRKNHFVEPECGDSDAVPSDDEDETDEMRVDTDDQVIGLTRTRNDEESDPGERISPEYRRAEEVLLPKRKPVFCLSTRADEYQSNTCGSLSHWPASRSLLLYLTSISTVV